MLAAHFSDLKVFASGNSNNCICDTSYFLQHVMKYDNFDWIKIEICSGDMARIRSPFEQKSRNSFNCSSRLELHTRLGTIPALLHAIANFASLTKFIGVHIIG